MSTITVLLLPGLYNSGDKHWQTHWEDALPDFRRVLQTEWERPVCSDWVETLDRAVAAIEGDVVLVAHSLACTLVAKWAERYPRPIRGAFLVAPSDTEADSYPSGTEGFTPVPLGRLPFPSQVVVSRGDPYVSIERATAFAHAWGSQLSILDGLGHIGSDSNLRMWPQGLALLNAFASTNYASS
jgi:predicted alpha/beta hydrolase family esterase